MTNAFDDFCGIGIHGFAAAGAISAGKIEMLVIPCLQKITAFDLVDIFRRSVEMPELRAVVFLGALIVATLTDLRRGKIHNWLTLPLMIFALVHASFVDLSGDAEIAGGSLSPGLKQSIAGGLVCFWLMFLHYATSGGGGGDVKLATAVGFGFGAEAGLVVIASAYFMAWLGDNAIRSSLDVASRLKCGRHGMPSPRRGMRRKIRMAPWFLLAMLPVLAGYPLS